ncbi:ribosome-associated translation inhibitor RaiA [Myxococcota bacterium]|nr:ribosome-associated translation inhibitor RaiA [Myxococcota bacterium]
MHVTVTFRNAEPTEALKQYASQKLLKLKKVLIKPEEAHVIYSVEKFRHHVELIVSANGERFVCNEESKDMYEAVDLALGRIEVQLRRYKERVRQRKGEPGVAGQAQEVVYEEEMEPTPV